MSWIAVAIGGSALLGYLGSQSAASAQRDAANQANQTQWSMYNQTRRDNLPWLYRGNAAGNQLAFLLGIPGYNFNGYSSPTSSSNGMDPTFQGSVKFRANDLSSLGDYNYSNSTGSQTFAPNSSMGAFGSLSTPFNASLFQADPGYQFRLAEGQKALDRSAASKGMLLSGAQIKATDDYNQDMASQEYQNAYNRYNNDQTTLFNRLAALSGNGQTAGNMLAGIGANTANQVGNNQLGAGNATAAGWTAGTGALSNGLNTWGNWSAWNNLNNANNANYMGDWSGSGPWGTNGAWMTPYNG